MGLFDDLAFHLKNYVSYKTRDTIAGEFMRTHLKDEIRNNDNISDSTKGKVADDLIREDTRQFIKKFNK